jgi:hypothetical protein
MGDSIGLIFCESDFRFELLTARVKIGCGALLQRPCNLLKIIVPPLLCLYDARPEN